MPAILVPTTKTSYNREQMTAGFIKGWQTVFNIIPKKESVGVILSQNAIETGSTASMWNNNIGNFKYSPSKNPENDNVKYIMLNNVWEILGGKKVIFQPPHVATWFRAFDTLEEGVAFHLDHLKNKRYKNSWQAVEKGDPILFAHLLKVAGYYTAPEADYAKGMNFHFNKFMKDNTFEKVLETMNNNQSAISSVIDLFTDTFKTNS
jgi:flagellar protein FlgJ